MPARRKLTTKQLLEARAMWRSGASFAAVAAHCCMNPWPMEQALRGMTYRDVPDPIRVDEMQFWHSIDQRRAAR
jgi:hypothetical protein